MDYQTFVDKLNEKEFIKTIENALGYNVDVFVNVEKRSVSHKSFRCNDYYGS